MHWHWHTDTHKAYTDTRTQHKKIGRAAHLAHVFGRKKVVRKIEMNVCFLFVVVKRVTEAIRHNVKKQLALHYYLNVFKVVISPTARTDSSRVSPGTLDT